MKHNVDLAELELERKRYKEYLKEWYDYNYQNIGSDWLIHVLDKLFQDKEDITFVSLSANKGTYEEDAFYTLSEKYSGKLTFVLSDLCGDVFYDNKKERLYHSNWLRYLKGSRDADNLNFRRDVDVILDNKGALWAKLNRGRLLNRKEAAIKLLWKYTEYLKDDESILLIDCYKVKKFHFLKSSSNIFKYRLFRGRIMNTTFHDFEEKSTFFYLTKKFKGAAQYFEFTDHEVIKAGTQSMKLAMISRKDLIKFIERYK